MKNNAVLVIGDDTQRQHLVQLLRQALPVDTPIQECNFDFDEIITTIQSLCTNIPSNKSIHKLFLWYANPTGDTDLMNSYMQCINAVKERASGERGRMEVTWYTELYHILSTNNDKQVAEHWQTHLIFIEHAGDVNFFSKWLFPGKHYTVALDCKPQHIHSFTDITRDKNVYTFSWEDATRVFHNFYTRLFADTLIMTQTPDNKEKLISWLTKLGGITKDELADRYIVITDTPPDNALQLAFPRYTTFVSPDEFEDYLRDECNTDAKRSFELFGYG